MTNQPVLQDGDALRNAIEREEKYLHSLIEDAEVGSVMHGDIEGAFHRLRNALDASTPAGRDEPLCSCKASARDGQHMMWCSAVSNAAPPKPAPDAMREAITRATNQFEALRNAYRGYLPWDSDNTDVKTRLLQIEDMDKVFFAALCDPPPPPPAPVPSGDGMVKALHRELRINSDHDYREWQQIEQAMTTILSPSDAGAAEPVALAYEINSALTAYLDAIGRGPGGEVEKRALQQILWDNKAGIVAHLLAPPVRGDREAIARALFKNRSKFDDKTVNEWFQIYADNPSKLGDQYLSIWRAYSDADAILSLPSAPVSGRDAVIEDAIDYKRHWLSFLHGWFRNMAEAEKALEAAEQAKLFDATVHRALSPKSDHSSPEHSDDVAPKGSL